MGTGALINNIYLIIIIALIGKNDLRENATLPR